MALKATSLVEIAKGMNTQGRGGGGGHSNYQRGSEGSTVEESDCSDCSFLEETVPKDRK